MFDKTYTNISEYYLRGDGAVLSLLRSVGQPFEIGSDFDLLTSFLKACREKHLCDSSCGRAFSEIVKKLIGEENAFSLHADEIWMRTSKALLEDENKLRASVASSGLESVGVCVGADDEFDAHFVRCGSVDISPVLCPFGTESVSLDTINKRKSIESIFDNDIHTSDSIALFFEGFSFEIPNEYSAFKAYEKHMLDQTLSYKEADILKAQLIRQILLLASKNQKETMMFLPSAPDVRAMGEVAALVDYIDESNIKGNVTIYAGDAVGLCMAQSIAGKKRKNITAATGISGNGSCLPDKDIAAYFGVSGIEKRASLSKTAAGLIKE